MMYDLTVILGPTASGKTRYAVKMAAETDGEIISADSRQVYRGMDIGTGKDLGEYRYNGITIPYHLIDIADAGTKYNLFEYCRDFAKVYEDIRSRGKYPILCGGTGLYIEAVTRGYSIPEVPPDLALREELERLSMEELTERLSKLKKLHNTTDIDSKKRAIRAIEIALYEQKIASESSIGANVVKREIIDETGGEDSPLEEATFEESRKDESFENAKSRAKTDGKESGAIGLKSWFIGISVDREERNRRIDARLKYRLENGMVEEVRGLLDSGISPEDMMYYGLEYKFVTQYLINQLSYEEMERQLGIAIHQFAKRQMTWFRGMERRGIEVEWIKT
jgi:tRNA delta(2)-isopentenylpyrophosphate transferase